MIEDTEQIVQIGQSLRSIQRSIQPEDLGPEADEKDVERYRDLLERFWPDVDPNDRVTLSDEYLASKFAWNAFCSNKT